MSRNYPNIHLCFSQREPDETGWAMMPHRLASDPRLSAVDVRIILALIYYAKSKHTCTPCDTSIAARVGGIATGSVQRSLKRLEDLGYITRVLVPPTDLNRTGRVIHLTWRVEGHTSIEIPTASIDATRDDPPLDQRREDLSRRRKTKEIIRKLKKNKTFHVTHSLNPQSNHPRSHR